MREVSSSGVRMGTPSNSTTISPCFIPAISAGKLGETSSNLTPNILVPGIGTRYFGLCDLGPNILSNRPDDGGKSGSGDKENEQAKKHPGHSAHAAAAFPNLTAGGCGHRSDRSSIRRKGTGWAVSVRCSWR